MFVVALLMARIPFVTMPRRYADYVDADANTWSENLLIADSDPGLGADGWFAVMALAGLAVTLVAAVAESVLARRWAFGVANVVVPVVAAAVFLLAGRRMDWAPEPWSPLQVFALFMTGVAIREVWSRGFAPKHARPTDRAAT
ncbi:hypothetical protein [Mycolicibacterium brumae]|uniref:Uncharacterized protein n=1 Tax=Mycolicibacterium brumae TaxID=85968 RepID=A0A2G5PD76_9MYCO|nr:hypothetical protein [Mycolicibacterium brumae]MCV7191846.1 hypothetical protein [Mycolicibacterium brumae]PIB76275.1 hypothetical protein CQY22_006020 [Mycolicibacterium brumae]RWA15775.1 hypothetical protein MBRU_09495 [Mycolicibacterium brumae DSM 44177]UWW07152.1 hypothetical protein L2Z93_000145 [Mycolicibacterium brumae]